MKRRKVDVKNKLLQKIEEFSEAKILVLGDIMLDQFVWGEVSRISPEAPVPIVQVERESFLLGGAANVANNLRSLNAEVILSGVIGSDNFGSFLLDLCNKDGIDPSGIIQDSDRPTTLKTRIIARSQQVVRVDREDPKELSNESFNELKTRLLKLIDDCEAIIISDYNKGVITKKLIKFVMEKATSQKIPVLIDPKPSNACSYLSATVITPNKKEAEELSGIKIDSEENVYACAERLAEKFSLQAVLLTRGPEGMDLWQRNKGLFSIPTMAREVFDVTGAGDTVISLFALGIVSGLSFCEAAYLSNLAAGIVVGKVGTATVTKKELVLAVKNSPEIKIHSARK